MRLFGVLTGPGVDPFSLAQALDRFHESFRIQPSEPFFVYTSDPNSAVVTCWAESWSGHVLSLPDSEQMVRDYVSALLIVESRSAIPDEGWDRRMEIQEEAIKKGVTLVSIPCSGCPA